MSVSILSKFWEAIAAELARVQGRAGYLLDESIATAAMELLPEYESELALESMGTFAERVARVIAAAIARQRYRPIDFQTALASILGLSPEQIVIIERTHAQAVAMGDEREIYRFFIYRDPTLPGIWYITSAQQFIDKIKPSHTLGYAIESNNFLCDDPLSLTDRDILGV